MPIAQFQLGQGGAELQAHKLARTLIARGHTVEIVSTRPRGTARLAVVEGVPVRRLPSFGDRRGLWRLDPYTYTPSLLARLVLTRAHHDVVHVHQAFHPAWAALLARRAGGRPVVVKVATAGAFGDLTQMREGRATLPIGSRRMLESILHGADALVAISSAIADELAAAGAPRGRIVRIPNGVELPPVVTAEARRAARRSLGLEDGQPTAVYVGRAGAQKGSDVLLRAWRDVMRAHQGWRLLLLGEGLDRDPLLEGLAPSVVATGKVRDVPRYLAAADLFVLPSRGEGLSNAVLEAMAHGLPCLTSDLQAHLDLVEPGRTGLTVPVDDDGALAATLVTALGDLPRLAPLGVAARARVEERFTLDAVAQAYEQLYATVAA